MLAGMSTDHYTRLERGNLSGVSGSVLDALARPLQLDKAERTHLFDLAATASPPGQTARSAPGDPAHGAYAGPFGRGHPERDPGTRLQKLAAESAQQLQQAAAEGLRRPSTRLERTGRTEREVVAAAEGADLLILARDGDRAHLEPRSLSPATRFVVDHAPCAILLVWPDTSPGITTIPPARSGRHADRNGERAKDSVAEVRHDDADQLGGR